MSSPNARAFAFGSHHGGLHNPYTTGHQQRFSPRLKQKYDGGRRPSYIYPNHPSSHSSAFADTDPYQRQFLGARESAQREEFFHFSPDTHRVQPNRLQFSSSRNHYTSSLDMEEAETGPATKKRSLPKSSTKKRQNKNSRRIIQESSSDNSSDDSLSDDDTPKKEPRAKKAARTKTNTSQVQKNNDEKVVHPPHANRR